MGTSVNNSPIRDDNESNLQFSIFNIQSYRPAPTVALFVAPSEARNGSMALFDIVTDMHEASPYSLIINSLYELDFFEGAGDGGSSVC